MIDMAQPFRILRLNGGGVKGAFSASVLQALEESTGPDCVDHFDVITGTSTGGIIALGLGLGLPAKTITDFYRDKGSDIFPVLGVVKGSLARARQLLLPKHRKTALRDALVTVFGDRRPVESRCRLVIPAYDASTGRIYVFKTVHYQDLVHDYEIPAVDVTLATSSAPTFFAATKPAGHQQAAYVDGGEWANWPAIVGLTEALGFLDQHPQEVAILSIGTTTEPFFIS